ncbi:Ion transport protein-domain-containing protein [Syncephalis fuscata]|nr:Ion transport protein-domain-containing protein [Syncephalis fuscata]
MASRMPMVNTPGGGTRVSFSRSDRSRQPTAPILFNSGIYNDPHRPPLGGHSFGVFGPHNRIRIWLARLLQNRWTEPIILVLVMLNCLLLAFDTRQFNQKELFGDSWLDYALLGVFVIYTIEVAVKMIVFGVFINPPPIQRSQLNTTGRRKARRSSGADQSNEKTLAMSQDHLSPTGGLSASVALSPGGATHLRRRDSSRRRHKRSHSNQHKSNKSNTNADFDELTAGVSPFPSPCGSAFPSPIHSDVSDESGVENHKRPITKSPSLIFNTVTESNLNTTCNTTAINTEPLSPKMPSSKPWYLNWWPLNRQQPDPSSTNLTNDPSQPPIKPILPHTAYLRHTFNRIDFIAVVAFWIDLAIMAAEIKGFPLFKGLAALRPVRLLVITSGLATITQSLKVAMPLLVDVTGFITFFLIIFGIIALETFKGSLSRHCVMDSDEALVTAPIKYCGSYIDLNSSKIMSLVNNNKTLSNIATKGYTCPANQLCRDMNENPMFGFLGYDHIFMAILAIVTSVSTEGWTDTMYWTMDAEYGLAALYYCILIITMTFIIMQLFIAVITESFGQVRADKQSSAFLSAGSDPLLLHHDAHETLAARAAASRMELEEAWMMAEEGRRRSLRHRIHTVAAKCVNHPVFVYLGGALAAANLGIMATRTEHSTPRQENLIVRCETAFTAVFVAEIIVRIYAAPNWSIFWRRTTNRVDLFLAIVTAIIQFTPIHELEWYRYLTVLHVMRFYRVVPLIPRINVMAANMFKSVRSFINVIFFLMMTLLVASTVTMQVFSGSFEFNNDNNKPALNFDTFGDAYLSLFVILTGENWNVILYDCMRSQKGAMIVIAALFVVIFYCFSHYVISNLFVAVLLENFELDEEEKRARQIVNFLSKREKREQYITGGLFSKLNPYLYMKPKPRLLQVSNLPKGMQAQVRKSMVRRMLAEGGAITDDTPSKIAAAKDHKYNGSLWSSIRRRIRGDNSDIAMEELNTEMDHHQQTASSAGASTPNMGRRKNSYTSGHSRQQSRRRLYESGVASQFSGITAIDEDDIATENTRSPDMAMISLTSASPSSTPFSPISPATPGMTTASNSLDLYGRASNDTRIDPSLSLTEEAPGLTKKAPHRARSGSIPQLDGRAAREAEFREAYPTYERSLFLFYPGSRIRRWCQGLLGTRETRAAGIRTWFDWLIILSIIGSVVVVVMDTPVLRRKLHQKGRDNDNIFPKLDAIFLVIFTVELLVRACADGFLFTPNAYIRDAWNRMDFLVLITLAAGMCFNASGSHGVERTFRATRAIRPLRLINQFRGTREIFFSTISTVPSILYTAALSILFVIPFAVYGVNVFAGYFAQCNDGDVNDISECVGEYLYTPADAAISILTPRVWTNPYKYSFDSFGSAILLLFEMASGEGWVDVLFTGMATPHKIGEQMQYTSSDPSWYNSIFFCVYMLFGSVVVVQLFIGVIVENLKTRSGIALLTVDQQRWIDLQRQLKMIRPTTMPLRPLNRLRAWCFDLAIDKRGRLSQAINAITVFNILMMMTEHKNQPHWWDKTKDIVFSCLIALYTLEVIIKLYGLGFKKWCKNRWNIFDLIVTMGALVTDICLAVKFQTDIIMQVQKLFLVAIAFKLVQRIESLQMLFKTLMASVPSIINIMTVLLLVFIVYAILFMEIFALTRYGRYTNSHANFQEFGNTLLLLLRMTTGENWNYVMHDMMTEGPYCVSNENYLETDCGSRYWALFLFISFYVIGTYILVNMFIVVVIDNFSYTYQRDIRAAYITRADLRGFKKVWVEYDPKATGYIPARVLPSFLRSLTGRFSVRIYDDAHDVTNLRRRAIKGQRGPGGGNTFIAEAVRVDVQRLNRSLAAMDVVQVRARRRRYNLVYQEAMLSQDSRGISFHAMLQVLAYSLVETEKCLQVEDLIIRQRKEEELLERAAREKVAGILRTLIQRRRFRQLVGQALGQARADGTLVSATTPQSASTAGQLDVPSIVVSRKNNSNQGHMPARPHDIDTKVATSTTDRARHLSAASFLSADDGTADPASDSDTGSLLLLSPSSGPSSSLAGAVQAQQDSPSTTTAMPTNRNVIAPSTDAWRDLDPTEITSENADSVLRNVTNNMWYGIMEEEREREAIADLNSNSPRSSVDL